MNPADEQNLSQQQPAAGAEQPNANSPALPSSPEAVAVPSEVPVSTDPGPTPEPAPAASPLTPQHREHEGDGWLGSIQSLLITVVIAVFVISFVVQAFEIPSESMENTLLIGDYLLVDKAHYGPAGHFGWIMPYRKIKRGDIIVFRYPIHPAEHFVKRVIGVPGDRVKIVRKRVYVNEQMLVEPYTIFRESYPDSYRDNFPAGNRLSAHIDSKWYLLMDKLVEDGELIVPEGSYFVLGDNRDESLDSRYWGFVPIENVIGRPLVIYFSLKSPKDTEGDEQAADDKLPVRRLFAHLAHDIRWSRMLRLIQ